MGVNDQLSAVVGFTDTSGRTSCALEELEHYRLRTLGMIQVAKTQRERCYQNKLWLLHWHSRIRYLAATSSTESPAAGGQDGTSRDGMPQRRAPRNEIDRYKRLKITKADEIPRSEAKQAKVEAEIEIVLQRYSGLIHPTVCSELYDKVPRELRNMVYLYIDEFRADIEVKHSTHGTNGVPTSPFFDGDCSAHAWDKAFYFDPDCVGPDLAREMVELQYGRSKFCLNDDALIPRLLNEDRWTTGAVPRNHIRQIDLDVLDEKEFEVEAAKMRLSENVGLLRYLEPGAKISINLFKQKPLSCDGIEDQREGELVPATAVTELTATEVCAQNLRKSLAPVVQDLERHGHRVVFLGEGSKDLDTPSSGTDSRFTSSI